MKRTPAGSVPKLDVFFPISQILSKGLSKGIMETFLCNTSSAELAKVVREDVFGVSAIACVRAGDGRSEANGYFSLRFGCYGANGGQFSTTMNLAIPVFMDSDDLMTITGAESMTSQLLWSVATPGAKGVRDGICEVHPSLPGLFLHKDTKDYNLIWFPMPQKVAVLPETRGYPHEVDSDIEPFKRAPGRGDPEGAPFEIRVTHRVKEADIEIVLKSLFTELGRFAKNRKVQADDSEVSDGDSEASDGSHDLGSDTESECEPVAKKARK